MINDVGEVGNEITLVPVRQDCRYASVVEINLLVVDLDEMDHGMLRDKRSERIIYELGDLTLGKIEC